MCFFFLHPSNRPPIHSIHPVSSIFFLSDFDALYTAADPAAPALCLAAGPDGTWSLGPPHPDVPPPLPEPCVGINFAKDGTSRAEWATVLAAHCDAWLMSLAAFFMGAAGLGAAGRQTLFDRINALDPLFDAVQAWAHDHGHDGGDGGGGYGGDGGAVPPPPTVARGGGSSPRPAGRPLTEADITPALKGAACALFWPDDARWYLVDVSDVSPRARTAQVRYPSGELETLDLDEVMREGHVLLVE